MDGMTEVDQVSQLYFIDEGAWEALVTENENNLWAHFIERYWDGYGADNRTAFLYEMAETWNGFLELYPEEAAVHAPCAFRDLAIDIQNFIILGFDMEHHTFDADLIWPHMQPTLQEYELKRGVVLDF